MRIIFPTRPLVALLLVGLAGAGALVAYLYLPTATVTLHARSVTRDVAQEIFLSSHAQEADFAKYVLPTRIVDRTIEDEVRIQREGLTVTEDFAKGTIVLVNEQDEEQPLLPRTHLKHEASGRYFLTDTAVTIPPRNSVAMAITAKEKGEGGNVPPGRFIIDKLPSSLQSAVYGEGKQQLSGGVVVESPLTEEEITKAREELLGRLAERLRGELTADAGGAALREDLIVVAPEEEQVSASSGSKAATFAIKMKIRGRAFVVDENDLLSLTLLALRAHHGADEEFVSYDPESFRLGQMRADFERGEAQVTGTLSGTFANKIGPTVLNEANLAGLTDAEVKEHFAHHPAVGGVDVAFSPFWVTSIPARPEAVDVVIKEAQ